MIEVRDATHADLVAILQDLRPVDVMELTAAGAPLQDPDAMARLTLGTSPGTAWTVARRGRLVAAFGLAVAALHIRQAWAWGTPGFWRAVPVITRLQPAIARNAAREGVTRIQAAVHERHEESLRWLPRHMGFAPEGRMRRFGRDGADFVLYALTDFGGDESRCASEAPAPATRPP